MAFAAARLCLLLGFLASVPVTYAEDAAATRGLAIARKADARDEGFGDSIAAVTMILKNARGETAERQLIIKTLEQPQGEDGDWSLVVFESPADVDGTALLTHAKGLAADDQWLYLPALKRVKRIASNNQSGPFMGSEFAYEDMAAAEVEKYSYRYLRDEACNNLECHVIERTPLYENSGYSLMVVWIDKDELSTHKIEYFDNRGEHAKTLIFRDYRQYSGQYWRAHDMEMTNHQTGKSTRLLWSSYIFASGFSESDFSRASLSRQ